MTIEISAFSWVPAFAQGYVRDLRVRWALEEAGLPYEATLLDARVGKPPAPRIGASGARSPARTPPPRAGASSDRDDSR